MFNLWKIKRRHIVDKSGKILKSVNPPPNYNFSSPPKKRKIFLLGIVLVIFLLAWYGGFVIFSLGKILSPNLDHRAPFLNFLDKMAPGRLKGEGDGRINIILLGIGGGKHPGAELADTIILLSINPLDKTTALLSIPRDLYVEIPSVGYNKINYAHSYGEQYLKNQGGGSALIKKTIGKVLDLPIHYFIRIDFAGFSKLVDSLGGVLINIEKPIYDPYFPAPDMVGYEPFSISAGLQRLDGKTALKYARSRETTSDFDRARRQQQLLVAIKEQTLSVGILANPGKVIEIIQILGDHLRTDLSIREIERLISISKDFPSSKIVMKVLDSGPEGYLIPAPSSEGFYLKPKTGDWSEIQRMAHEIFTEPYLIGEKARVEIINGNQDSSYGNKLASLLKSYGYNVIGVKSGEKNRKTIIYDYTAGQAPYTLELLSKRLKAPIVRNEKSSPNQADISIIIGEDFRI